MPLLDAMEAADYVLFSTGVLLLLFGWVLYRVALKMTGAVFGATIGMGLGAVLAAFAGWESLGTVLALVCGGVLGAGAGILVIETFGALAFFVIGAFLSGWAFTEFAPAVRSFFPEVDPDLVFFGGAVTVIIVGGLLFFLFRKFIVALGSAAIGSILVMVALDWPAGGTPLIVIFPIGLIVQLIPRRRRGDEDDDDED
ncbi:MAG: hypothetical protein PWP23_1460 [Candidatus Sumerlaeota bacterium]|nr:hypothetical protein [Candidatus Sumerlaeota bacterium]